MMRQQVVKCPFWAAKWSGVMPRLFVGFLWLTLSIMSRHISEWPLCAAQWSGVLPWSLAGFLSSTHSMIRRQIPTWPNCAAAWNGVPPMNKIHFRMFVTKHFVNHQTEMKSQTFLQTVFQKSFSSHCKSIISKMNFAFEVFWVFRNCIVDNKLANIQLTFQSSIGEPRLWDFAPKRRFAINEIPPYWTHSATLDQFLSVKLVENFNSDVGHEFILHNKWKHFDIWGFFWIHVVFWKCLDDTSLCNTCLQLCIKSSMRLWNVQVYALCT